MKNYKLIISYDGTRYSGWEHQPDRDTVQGRLEAVLARLEGSPVELIGAGRTDAGVHAKGMVANVRLSLPLSEESLRSSLNRYLPEDICVTEVREAAAGFHARYKAVGKLYTYTCYTGDLKPLFTRKYVTVLDFKPDLERMRAAAAFLIGEMDYRSFCSNPNMKKSTVRTVDSLEIVQKKDLLYFHVHGSGFLQNMVRILVGTLLEVGRGTLQPEDIPVIQAARDRRLAGPTAPPQGLCLMRVDY